jgi:hypothetical protein
MRRRDILGAALAAPAILRAGFARAGDPVPVDVELVLAVDCSRSVDPEEQEIQFKGYEAAFRDPQLIEGITGGPVGAIACMMFLWSGWNIQRIVAPWALIDSAESAHRFADAIAAAPRRTWLYTSISGAMDFAAGQFGQGFEGMRRVVDISGDGVNNSGRPVEEARAAALAQGITLNGLAVLDRTPQQPFDPASAPPPLDDYYRDEVIGGPGAFLVVADGFPAFEAAVRRKIIREIASLPPPGPLVERYA